MTFGSVPLDAALGAVLAHSMAVQGGRLRKGLVLDESHLDALRHAGHVQVTVARLTPDDVDENTAATRLAKALVPDPEAVGLRVQQAFTGRVNILADGPGVVCLDAPRLHAMNRVDPMITLATVPAFHQVRDGDMVGTVKIISYGVAGALLDTACAAVRSGAPVLRLARPQITSVSLIVTEIPGGAGEKGVEAIRTRVTALGGQLVEVVTCPHDSAALAEALGQARGELVLILTGSATSDLHDVAPEAVGRAGGQVLRFGMPVDPGNLLFLGDHSGRPVIGLPGCARSPALNGADWVLSRVICGLEVSDVDIAHMGVGGLLKEIPTRPQPRRGDG